jgi:hypothetical protein
MFVRSADADGATPEPTALVCQREKLGGPAPGKGGAARIARVALLRLRDPLTSPPAAALIDLLASALLDQGELDAAVAMTDLR